MRIHAAHPPQGQFPLDGLMYPILKEWIGLEAGIAHHLIRFLVPREGEPSAARRVWREESPRSEKSIGSNRDTT